jgi:8-oxo-dGTP pyrophosphatase MutT (NUDIX family)
MGAMAPSRSRPLLEQSAGGLVVDDRGQVLLIRARDLRNRAVWTLPKGALMSGETGPEAALREVREETGYRCHVVRELEAVTYWFQRDGQRIRKTVRWYLMRPLEKVGEHDHEVDEVAWVGPPEALARLRYDSDRRLVGALPAARISAAPSAPPEEAIRAGGPRPRPAPTPDAPAGT